MTPHQPTRLTAVPEPALRQLVAVGDLMAGICRAVASGPPLNDRELSLAERVPTQWAAAVSSVRVRR